MISDTPPGGPPRAPDLTIDRPIVLVGMMGSGKSSVGKRLAARLSLPFYDADDEIESAAGLKIAEIFERYGEPYFRDGERRVIQRLMEAGPCVLATGGGAFVQPDTRQRILDKGIAIWLDVPVNILVERTARRSHRPLLNQGNPREILTRLLKERGPAYAEAHLKVKTDQTPHARAVEAIIALLKEYLA
ncbi:shikimate kinase [Sphingomonas lacunae]|uniref:Shikimate kinase n=1 Tax=Sphingomonas lacunae TaxID=2698828 RepID=A0A6M4AZG6_9SPHN|nr:shikimate kinase [Sphingomonas lacunae]QJQ32431.1 shikimate kinase [Sphingomonas lacunae]